MAPLELSSPAFTDGDPLPRRYGYTADNANPPLEIRGVPDGTGALVLVVDDPDAVEPAGKIWNHWLVWNVDPDTQTIPEVGRSRRRRRNERLRRPRLRWPEPSRRRTHLPVRPLRRRRQTRPPAGCDARGPGRGRRGTRRRGNATGRYLRPLTVGVCATGRAPDTPAYSDDRHLTRGGV